MRCHQVIQGLWYGRNCSWNRTRRAIGPATRLIQATDFSRKPTIPSRTSRGPPRNWTKMLLGNWRRSCVLFSSGNT